MEFFLPSSLLGSDAFVDLSDDQKKSFANRLALAKNILEDAMNFLMVKDGEFEDFADGLELDLLSVAFVDMRDTRKLVSTWFVHSAWTFDVNQQNMAGLLTNEVRDRLDGRLPPILAAKSDLMMWFLIEVKMALSAFSNLHTARSFDYAVAYLIAIDAFISRMLTVLFMWRLWVKRP